MRAIICLSLFFLSTLAKHEEYDGFALYQVTVKSTDQISKLNDLESKLDLDVWSHAIPDRPGTVLVPKVMRNQFENELKVIGVEFNIETENIKEWLELEEKLLFHSSRKAFNASRVDLEFDQMYTYEQVDSFLEMLAQTYPDTVTLVNAGKSFEGRDIKYLKISTTNFQDESKPIVFMQSLLHAREWITLPATLYAIHKLVVDVTEQDLLQEIDWIILPIANPDGYVYSQDVSRLWRKNRAAGITSDGVCIGVDLNRNFDIFWSQASSVAACWETYHGHYAFSEPETVIIRDIMLQHQNRIELFLDIHSYGSLILYGYGMGGLPLPQNVLFLHLVGVQMAQAIDRVKMSWNGNYLVGNVALVLYNASGTAMDYAKTIGIPYSYTFELPVYRYGVGGGGFLVDPGFIEQAGFETWEGIKVGARYVRNNFRKRQSLE